MVAAAAIWALHFAVLYGATSVGCVRSPDAAWLGVPAVTWIVLAASACALVLLALTIARARRNFAAEPFLRAMTVGLCALAALAIVWETLPGLVLAPCR